MALPPRTIIIIVAVVIAAILMLVIISRCSAKAQSGQSTATVTTTVQQTSSSQTLNATTIEDAGIAGIKFGGAARKGNYSISVATTGDIMFAREVSNFIDMNGGAAALANVAPQLAAADVTFANLEAPLTDDESEELIGKDVLWRGNPAGIDALKLADITCVSLANNHIMDMGASGLQDTLNALDGAGIKHAGAGMTEREASEYAEITIDGVSIAFLSWTDIIPDNFLAYQDSAGVVSARLNMDDACKRVTEAKKKHDIVVVAMHWGVEYQPYIDEAQQQDPAHKLVDAGADIVWGNHPHVIEGIEFYKNSLISYSQGDFVCDHYSQETGETFILEFNLTPEGIKDVRATPVYLDDTYGIPSIVTGEHAQSILSRLEEISTGMNSSFTIRDDVAYITPTS